MDEAATELCGCGEALYYTSRKKRMEAAKRMVNRQFETRLSEKAVKVLELAVELIEADQIDSLTLDTGKGLKGKVSITARGGIKVEKTETKKEAQEA